MKYEMTADKSRYLVDADDMERLIFQRDQLREALEDAMRYFDQIIAETGYQSEGERIAHNKARATLKETEEW